MLYYYTDPRYVRLFMKKKDLLKKYKLEKYLQYASSEEAYAVLFVKKYLDQAEGMWVDIIDMWYPYHYEPNTLQFKKVICEVFPRTIKPKYPPKSDFQNDEDYYLVCRAITYDVAHKDIETQRAKGVHGKKYEIEGVRYFDNKKKKPPFFIAAAPKEIKALAKNLNDRTNPLWDTAWKYVNPDYDNFDEYSYKIKSITNISSL